MPLIVVKGLPMLKLKPLKKGSFMKKSLKVLIASSALILAGTLLAGCEEKVPVSQIHEHTFAEEWSSNDGSHWHAATCEHSDLMKDVKAHTFGAWKEDKAATETEEGSQSRTCSECGYVQHAAIAKLAHVHVFDETKFESDDDNHWHKATCHPEIITGVTKHTYGEWTVKVQPTETTKGQKERTCSVCQHVQKADVDTTLHVHTFEDAWQSDDSNHWHKASCGHNEVYGSFAPHDFGNPVVVDSTETVQGTKTYTCQTCGHVLVEKLPLLEHTHKFATSYEADDDYHWHPAECHPNVTSDKVAHTYSAWSDVANSVSAEYPNGKQSRQCFDCNHIQYRAKAHEHALSGWQSDADSHWKECIAQGCNEGEGHVFEEAAHTLDRDFSDWYYPVKCSVCGYVKYTAWRDATEIVPFDRYITLPAKTNLSFTFNLMQKTRPYFYIRCANTDYNSNLYAYMYKVNDNGTSTWLASGYIKDTYTYQSSRTCDENTKCVFVLKNATNEPIDVLIHNATPSYSSAGRVGTKTFTIDGVNQTYTMYRFNGNLGNTSVLYTVEDAEGEEVYTISNPQINGTVNNFRDAYAYFYDANGNYREAHLPMYIYRSNVVTSRLYTSTYDTTTKAVTVYPMENALYQAYKNDEWLRRENYDNNAYYDSSVPAPQKYTDLELHIVAWFMNNWCRINDAQWSYDPDTQKVSSLIYGHGEELCGFKDEYTPSKLGNYASEMAIGSNYEYRYKRTATTGAENYILKMTNGSSNDGIYSRFKAYYNASLTGRYTDLSFSSNLTIFDTSFNRVTDHFFSESSTSHDYWGRRYTYNHTDDYFEIEPGDTYYFVVSTTYYAGSNSITYAIEQTKYNVTLDAGDLGGEGGLEPIVAKEYNLVNQDVYGDELYDLAMSNWEVPEGKILAGFYDDYGTWIPAARYGDDDDYRGTYFIDQYADTTLTAAWIDSTDVVAYTYSIMEWDTDLSIMIVANFDSNLSLSVDDAVEFHYEDGHVEEQLVTEIWGKNSSDLLDTLTPDGEQHWVFFDNLNTTSERDSLVYISIKREFTLTANADGNGLICAPGCGDYDYDVDKGDTVTLELFKDMFDDGYDLLKDCGGENSYKYYFAGWGGGRDGATDVIVYDGGSYTPIRDETLTAIFKESADSGMVCLGKGDSGYEFKVVEDDGKVYLELKILDPNLTIKGDLNTEVTLRFADGRDPVVVAVQEVLGGASGWSNLNSGATRADGIIHIRLRGSVTTADLANVIQIYVA